jgi:hypothetical protein
VIEVTCQTCAEKVGVQSFLAAAQQPCTRCGNLLMGALARDTRSARPAGFGDLPQPFEQGRGGGVGVWLGAFAGGLVGLAGVCAVGYFAPAIPANVRGAVVGALSAVLLAPVLAVGSFLLMLLPGFNLIGMVGDSAWSRVAKALHQRQLRHLVFPVCLFVVLPMALGGWGGWKLAPTQTPALLGAARGARLLGAGSGGVLGGRSR